MIPDAEHYNFDGNMDHQSTFDLVKHTGQLDKLGLMDMILDSGDRHVGNYMLTPNRAPYLHLIDNGMSMSGDEEPPRAPTYWSHSEALGDGFEQPLHPDAVAWAQKLRPEKLKAMLGKLGVPQQAGAESVRRLNALQRRLARGGKITRSTAYFAPFTSAGRGGM
jgi:hypothetical protein